MNHIKLLCLCLLLLGLSCKTNTPDNISKLNISIPTIGNSWVINNVAKSSEVISKEGISNWTDANDIIRSYFYSEKADTIPFAIVFNSQKEVSKLTISYNSHTKNIKVNPTEKDTVFIDNYIASEKGYQYIDLQGIQKEGNTFANISEILLGVKNDSIIKFIKDDFYFGRRGPSTHLVYETPTNDIEWMYSEIEIDSGQDVKGSYFMANGFGEGYFGIQVNSETERRILFSIWSPYKTDDPSSIPEEFKIKLLKKGNDVNTGEFGNEGSGGQSYKVFNWKAETRYGFLTGIKPNGDNTTTYTSYFFDPDTEQWNLIASFKRPKTTSYVTKPYSFLENFIPNTGALSRKGGFFNQWMRDTKGQWHEITEAKFSADATARKDARLDYSGGASNDGFYLMNCGFTNDYTSIDTVFKRNKNSTPPKINFEDLD